MRSPEDILDKFTKKQESKIADLSPEERADLERRQRERMKRVLKEAKRRAPQLFKLDAALDAAFVVEELATKNPDVFNSSLEKIFSEYPPEEIEAFLDKWREATYLHLDGISDDLDDIARDHARAEGRRQGVESAANLQGVLAEIAGMKAQGDRLEAKADEVKTSVIEIGQGVKDAAREGAKKAVETTLPKEYAKAANMSDEELREATKPKTRSHGGGRKKERDLDDAQVKAVLADMEKLKRESLRASCDYIIKTMKDGMYQNPYETAKDLDAAVRRYCKKNNGIPLVVKARTGRWSAKK